MRTRSTLLVAAALLAAPAASAQQVSDPEGDVRTNYNGPQNGDVDVLSAGVFFDGQTFRFVSRSNGAIGTTENALFVWGVDRGAGTPRFAAIAPGVTFDAVVIINPLGTTMVRDLVSNGAPQALPVGAVSFSGSTLTALVPASFLPSLGLRAPSAYTANLWPRVGAGDNDRQISDFAPDNSNIAVVTPEPATGALLAAGVGLLAAAVHRRRTL